MMKKGRLLFLLIVLFAVACSPDSSPQSKEKVVELTPEQKEAQKKEAENNAKKLEQYGGVNPDKVPYVQVTVVDQSQVAGCGFLLELKGGKRLEPANLENKYKSHGKTIWVKYMPSQAASNCNTGKVVKIISTTEKNPN